MVFRCGCGGLLEVSFDLDKVKLNRKKIAERHFNIWRYRELLPLTKKARVISLDEGGTPFYRAENLGKALGLKHLYIKNEGANPTGSFKDRGMSVGVSKALEFGFKTVGCASTGNTSASLSAYAAKAGLRCVVLLPAGKIAKGKLAQALLHGASVIGIRGNFDEALRLVLRASAEYNIYLLNSINPWRLEGQKTEAYEIAEQLDWEAPDAVVVPMGNCGNISAIWKGFKEFEELGFIDSLPRMIGIQAAGAAPVARAFKEGRTVVNEANPETVATAIRIGAPVNAPKAMRAIKESGGSADFVSDEEILNAQRSMAEKEGIGVEPASAAPIAGLAKLLREGVVDRDERIVCIATGHALKDPEIIFSRGVSPIEINPDLAELGKAMGALGK